MSLQTRMHFFFFDSVKNCCEKFILKTASNQTASHFISCPETGR